jgi:hypothetical protein
LDGTDRSRSPVAIAIAIAIAFTMVMGLAAGFGEPSVPNRTGFCGIGASVSGAITNNGSIADSHLPFPTRHAPSLDCPVPGQPPALQLNSMGLNRTAR